MDFYYVPRVERYFCLEPYCDNLWSLRLFLPPGDTSPLFNDATTSDLTHMYRKSGVGSALTRSSLVYATPGINQIYQTKLGRSTQCQGPRAEVTYRYNSSWIKNKYQDGSFPIPRICRGIEYSDQTC